MVPAPSPNSGGALHQGHAPDGSGHLLFLGFPAPIRPPVLKSTLNSLLVITGSLLWEYPRDCQSRNPVFFLWRVITDWSWPIKFYSRTVHLEQGHLRTVKRKKKMEWDLFHQRCSEGIIDYFLPLRESRAVLFCPLWASFFRSFLDSLSSLVTS